VGSVRDQPSVVLVDKLEEFVKDDWEDDEGVVDDLTLRF